MTFTDEDMELVHGSGNLFRDHGLPNPDLEQARSIRAGQILRALDEDGLTARQAHQRTGVPEADFSRIRKVKLDRFTIDRLMIILNKLGRDVEPSFTVNSRRPPAAAALQPAL